MRWARPVADAQSCRRLQPTSRLHASRARSRPPGSSAQSSGRAPPSNSRCLPAGPKLATKQQFKKFKPGGAWGQVQQAALPKPLQGVAATTDAPATAPAVKAVEVKNPFGAITDSKAPSWLRHEAHNNNNNNNHNDNHNDNHNFFFDCRTPCDSNQGVAPARWQRAKRAPACAVFAFCENDPLAL
ncbi:unnamed protein product [Polarella glacialis]|uniref:Uncharacterized protein n=1 Tax=Polarella glacialis TaxID=89957 RepID=A0A813F2E7_POLGL|nr:unnamed protein product [Polarella glacialis]